MALEFRQRLNRTFSTGALVLVRDCSPKGGESVVPFRSGVRSTTVPPTTLSFNIAASIGGTVAVKR
jgi:hypothetical protein